MEYKETTTYVNNNPNTGYSTITKPCGNKKNMNCYEILMYQLAMDLFLFAYIFFIFYSTNKTITGLDYEQRGGIYALITLREHIG